MGEPNFTPGPWMFHRPYSGFSKISGPGGALVFGIAAGSPDEKQPDDVCEANARLIASAPELYARLEDARITLEESAKILMRYSPSVAHNIVNMCAIRCGTSLSKARGET